MSASRNFAIACALALFTLPSVAAAEDVAAAKALFTEGLEHMQAGNYDKGCPALRESYRLDPRIGTLFTLAECEAKWGRVATAVAHYSNYLTQLAAMPAGQRVKQSAREKIAREQRDALAPLVPELTLMLPKDAPRGTVVKRNGEVLKGPSLGVPLPIDPGDHTITTQAPGGKALQKKITIEKGEKKTVTLEVSPPERSAEGIVPGPDGGAPGEGTPDGADGVSGRRVAAYVVGGLGIAGLALGGVMGGLTLAKRNEIDIKNGGGCDFDAKRCTPAADEERNEARTLGWVSTIGLGVGAAGVGAAAVLLLTEPRTQEAGGAAAGRAPKPKPRRTIGVLAADGSGMVLGVRGTW